MTKQELLTKLAIECATWEEAESVIKTEDEAIRTSGKFALRVISEQDWLDERTRLLNSPSWEVAPSGATYKAMDYNGNHWFYDARPNDGFRHWMPDYDGIFEWPYGEAIAIPAGYDWRDSLEARPDE